MSGETFPGSPIAVNQKRINKLAVLQWHLEAATGILHVCGTHTHFLYEGHKYVFTLFNVCLKEFTEILGMCLHCL